MSPVLIGVDGSGQSRDAVVAGARLAALRDKEVVLVHVRSGGPLESLLGGGQHEQLVRSIVEEALDVAAVAGLRAPHMELVTDRAPAVALQRLALRDEASAIVVGSSHRGSIGRVVPGGVAQRLLSGAPCPVVVAPDGFAKREPRPLATIGCGFDDSDGARLAWQAACALATLPKSVVRPITVFQRLPFGHIPLSLKTVWRSVNDELRRQLRARLDELITAAPDGVRAEPVFTDGIAAKVLTEASEALDLLVVGSRGYGPLGSVMMGSVGAQLIVGAACPVMVVPRPTYRGAAPTGEATDREPPTDTGATPWEQVPPDGMLRP